MKNFLKFIKNCLPQLRLFRVEDECCEPDLCAALITSDQLNLIADELKFIDSGSIGYYYDTNCNFVSEKTSREDFICSVLDLRNRFISNLRQYKDFKCLDEDLRIQVLRYLKSHHKLINRVLSINNRLKINVYAYE